MKKLLCFSLLLLLAVLPVRAAGNDGPVRSYNRGDHCYARNQAYQMVSTSPASYCRL